MLSTARCKVQTHYGQVLAYNTLQSREQCEHFSHYCSSPHFKTKQGLLLLFSKKKKSTKIRYVMTFKSKQRVLLHVLLSTHDLLSLFPIYTYIKICWTP